MNLFLLRHGLAGERHSGGNDAERPLTKPGRDEIARAAVAMRHLELNFDVILSSPYIRARETATIVANALGMEDRLRFSPALEPATSSDAIFRVVRALAPGPQNSLLVGHEPSLSHFASWLLFGHETSALVLKKGGFCKLTIEADDHDHRATLNWWLTPRQLQIIANALPSKMENL
ncbi:MAG TPA: phosphohistidine phosphatase SixA [Verrucomicrobiae bacterium]|nr:phosphohistidine phosphatase SixA [Verrucomicrobiae bacterium]